MATENATDNMGELIYVDFRNKCRVDAKPDDPVFYIVEVNCQNCPLKNDCFWLVKLFKRRLCPYH